MQRGRERADEEKSDTVERERERGRERDREWERGRKGPGVYLLYREVAKSQGGGVESCQKSRGGGQVSKNQGGGHVPPSMARGRGCTRRDREIYLGQGRHR